MCFATLGDSFLFRGTLLRGVGLMGGRMGTFERGCDAAGVKSFLFSVARLEAVDFGGRFGAFLAVLGCTAGGVAISLARPMSLDLVGREGGRGSSSLSSSENTVAIMSSPLAGRRRMKCKILVISVPLNLISNCLRTAFDCVFGVTTSSSCIARWETSWLADLRICLKLSFLLNCFLGVMRSRYSFCRQSAPL